MATTIEDAEKILGRKLKKIELQMIQMFGQNEKYEFKKDDNGKLSGHLKQEYR